MKASNNGSGWVERWLLRADSGPVYWIQVLGFLVIAYILAARVSYLLTGGMAPDFVNGYHPGAFNISQGAGYRTEAGELITHWPPGYSVFIVPWIREDVGESFRNLRHAAGGLATVWVLLIAWFGRRLVGSVPIWIILALAVLWPPMLALGNPSGSDMLFSVLSLLAVSLLFRLNQAVDMSPSWWQTGGLIVAIGGTLGAASLTKTFGLVLTGCCIAAMILIHRGRSFWVRALRATVVVMVVVATLLPWMRVFREHRGSWGITSAGFPAVRAGFNRFSSFPLGRELKERSEDWESLSEIIEDLCLAGRADPVGATRLLLTKVLRSWYGTDSQRFDHALMAVQLPWCLLFVIAVGRTLYKWPSIPNEIRIMTLIPLAFWVVTACTLPLVRYLAPVFPFVVIIVLWHLEDLRDVTAHRKQGVG